MKEVFYTDMEQKTGKTASQIRDGILRGEHNKVQIDEETGNVLEMTICRKKCGKLVVR
jgi:hypothetical protein